MMFWYRYNWKVDLIEETKRRANQPPVDIRGDFASHSSLNDNKEELTGRRLIVEGNFDHSREVLMGPRSAPAGLFGPAAQGLATNPLGFFVITPFKLSSG
jgi:cytochrome oxidase assembly protein ShyY1